MPLARPSISDRIGAALIATLVEALVFGTLLYGLAVGFPKVAQQAPLTLLTLSPPPEPIVPPPRPRPGREAGEAAPAGTRARASEVVAPPPLVPPPDPPSVLTATVADKGVDARNGASDFGAGPGAGGDGNGRGGGRGDGDGDGAGGGTPPRQIKGRIRNADYPHGAGAAGAGGVVGVRYLVGIDGRASDCEITRSSGIPELDDTTCRLIVERFRFRPSLDERGRPVPAYLIENHEWVVDDHDPPPGP